MQSKHVLAAVLAVALSATLVPVANATDASAGGSATCYKGLYNGQFGWWGRSDARAQAWLGSLDVGGSMAVFAQAEQDTDQKTANWPKTYIEASADSEWFPAGPGRSVQSSSSASAISSVDEAFDQGGETAVCPTDDGPGENPGVEYIADPWALYEDVWGDDAWDKVPDPGNWWGLVNSVRPSWCEDDLTDCHATFSIMHM